MRRTIKFIESLLEGTPYLKIFVWILITVIIVWFVWKFYRWISQFNLRWMWPKKKAKTGWQRFKQLLTELKAPFGSRDWFYDVPWYIVLHDEKRTSLPFQSLKSCNRMQPFSKALNNPFFKTWCFFDKGVLIPTHPENLGLVLNKVKQLRNERPIDGVIINISSDTFDNTDKSNAYADETYNQLWVIHESIGFSLPIYMIVDECDSKHGFEEFTKDFTTQKEQIWGWSNELSIDSVYQKDSIKQGFQLLNDRVRQLQLSLMASKEKVSDSFFLFPALFAEMTQNIEQFTNKLFHNSGLSSKTQLRGCYFSGISHDSSSNRSVSSDFSLPKTSQSDQMTTDNHNGSRCEPAFLNDVLNEKIFLECNIAMPIRQKWLSSQTSLRQIQYLIVVLLITFFFRLVLDGRNLNNQISDLTFAIEKVESIKESNIESGQGHIKELNQGEYVELINRIASMKAHSLDKLSIPASWHSSFQSDLERYFTNDIFGELLLPTLDKYLSNLKQTLSNDLSSMAVSGRTDPSKLSLWLNRYVQYEDHRKAFENLVRVSTKQSDLSLEAQKERQRQLEDFSKLSEFLMHIKLPESFSQNSDIYRDALAAYTTKKSFVSMERDDFIDSPLPEILKDVIKQFQFQQNEIDEFFVQLKQLQNSSVMTSLYEKSNKLSDSYKKYHQWFSSMEQEWLTNEPPCFKIQRELDKTFARSKHWQLENAITHFYDSCVETMNAVILAHNQSLGFEAFVLESIDVQQTIQHLVQNGEPSSLKKIKKIKLTEEGKQLFSMLTHLSSLSFVNSVAPNDLGTKKLDYFWSVGELQQALRAIKEYQLFSTEHFKSSRLPRDHSSSLSLYLSQALTLAELQQSIYYSISKAQQTNPKSWLNKRILPVEAKEAKLAAQIQYFKQSIDVLLELTNQLDQLEFAHSKQWLQSESRTYAQNLLKKVNDLSDNSRIYQPLKNLTWGRHDFSRALFDIESDSQISDYLDAQYARLNHLATNYAEPLILYLLNTENGVTNASSEEFKTWRYTLEQINRKQNNDPTNHASKLDNYFKTQLFGMNQSNCFEKGQLMAPIRAQDIFATAFNTITEKVYSHCQGLRKDVIKRQYRQVAKQFNQLIAGQYPFSSNKNAPEVTLAQLKTFFDTYKKLGNGLKERLQLVESKEKRFGKAVSFAHKLEQSSQFFMPLMSAIEQGKSPLISINTQYNVNAKSNSFAEHIAGWRFISGKAQTNYPGTNLSANWSPGDKVEVLIQWANGSPYSSSSSPYSDQFRNSGEWSLLHLIKDHRSNQNEGSGRLANDLLEFTIPLVGKDKASKTHAKAYINIGLSTFDAEKKADVPLVVPRHFPTIAPIL